MKFIILTICSVLLSFSASAQMLTFNSQDLEKIESLSQEYPSGMTARFKLSSTVAVCRLNDMSELLGYKCTLTKKDSRKNVSITLTNEDVENIEKAASSLMTGASTVVITKSKSKLLCKMNTMAELPGFQCSLYFIQ